MKKKPGLYFFGSINASKISLFVLYALSGALLFILSLLITSSNGSLPVVKAVIRAASRTSANLSDETITQAVLKMSLPALSISGTAESGAAISEPPSEQSPASEPPSEEKETIPPPPANNSYSVTYKTAEEKGYRSSDGIYVNNQTDKSFNINSLLNMPLDISAGDGPLVLIVHTHTSESYTPSAKYNYTPSDTDRTEDINYNMASVGQVVYERLTAAGINTIQDKSINDYPSYNGSYSKTLKLIESYIKKYPSIKVVLDIHRDAVIRQDGTKIRTAVNINGSDAAQVMFVVGTDQSGLEHKNWQKNLAFAVRLQREMNDLYPSLARPINLRKQRFNQHMTDSSLIVEVGTNGNTLEEAKYGAQLFCDSLINVLKGN